MQGCAISIGPAVLPGGERAREQQAADDDPEPVDRRSSTSTAACQAFAEGTCVSDDEATCCDDGSETACQDQGSGAATTSEGECEPALATEG